MPDRFSDLHAPPISPGGPVIRTGVREAIVEWFGREGLSASMIWRGLRLEQGFGSDWRETGRDLLARFPEDVVVSFVERNQAQEDRRMTVLRKDYDEYAQPSLLGVPDPLFLDAVEVAMDLLRKKRGSEVLSDGTIDYVDDRVDDAIAFVNQLFQRRGVDYRVREDGTVEWYGDAGAYQEVIAPALSVLEDSRLAGARDEFDAARAHLRVGTPKALEDAVVEAGKAVESMMKTLLDAQGVAYPSPPTAQPLWNALRDAGIVAPKAEGAILGASQLRNVYGAHGSGAKVRVIPDGIPELAVRSAAGAIVYLASQLP